MSAHLSYAVKHMHTENLIIKELLRWYEKNLNNHIESTKRGMGTSSLPPPSLLVAYFLPSSWEGGHYDCPQYECVHVQRFQAILEREEEDDEGIDERSIRIARQKRKKYWKGFSKLLA